MKKKLFGRCFSFLLAISLLVSSGCEGAKTSETTPIASDTETTASPSDTERTERYLFGINYVEMQMSDRLKTAEVAYLSQALGAESVRISAFCMETGTTFNEQGLGRLHTLLQSLKFSGIDQVILCQGTYPLEGVLGNYAPYPDLEDEEYLSFLEETETMSAILGKEFKEAEYFQIGHRLNDDRYLHPVGWKEENSPVSPFTTEEKAEITVDLCYRITKGLRSAGSGALVLMPAFTDYDTEETRTYLKTIYQLIASGEHGSNHVEDFFGAVSCMATFNEEPGQHFTDSMESLHIITEEAEDGKRHIFVSEIGFDEKTVGDNEKITRWMEDLYLRAKELTYIESVQYYRLFTDHEEEYGLIREPRAGFSPTAAGNAFYKLTGSNGDLEKYVIKEDQYMSGDNVALNVPTSCSSSCEHPGWGWSLAGINNGTTEYGGWSNYYELGHADWVTDPNGEGAPSADYPEWVSFELPYVWEVDTVLLYPRNEIDDVFHQIMGLPEEIRVEISEDGETWLEVASEALDPKVFPNDVTMLTREENPPIQISFEPVKTKHVRVFFTKLRSVWQHKEDRFFVQIEEIEILMH